MRRPLQGALRSATRGAGQGALASVIAIAIGVLLLALPAACTRDAPTVVAYTAVDEHAARPVFALFTERTGITVMALYDSEVTKTTGLVQRLRRERADPRADLFWSNEAVQASRLASEGVLRDGRDGLRPTMLRARVLVYDPARTSADELPHDWWQLSDPRFRGRVAMADPRFGTTATHLAAMHAMAVTQGEPRRFDDWCDALAANGVQVLTSGNAGVVRAVASGEADFGMTDTDDVAAINATLGSRALAMVALRHGDQPGQGPWLMPGLAGVVAGAPHAALAERLLEFLASDEAQQVMAAAAPGFHAVADAKEVGLVDGLVIDPSLTQSSLPIAIERFFDAMALRR